MIFFKFLISRVFWLNVLFAIILLVILFFGTFGALKKYTHHGEHVETPNFIGLTADKVASHSAETGVEYEIIDSIYIPGAERGAVVEQDPSSETIVKEGRTVRLVINPVLEPLFPLPDVIDVSSRQARAQIEASGFELGETYYEPSEYRDIVLQIQVDGQEPPPNAKYKQGTAIDMIVGQGPGNVIVNVPNLIGYNLESAKHELKEFALNSGIVIYDTANVLSSDDIKVWKQRPFPHEDIKVGRNIDIWVTNDTLKLEQAIEESKLIKHEEYTEYSGTTRNQGNFEEEEEEHEKHKREGALEDFF